jgi:hypothetical protein
VIDQAYYTNSSTDSSGVKSTTKGIGAQNNGTSEFTIAGSDDLGNGMKASFAFNVQAAIDTTAAGPVMRRSFVGLEGGFGSVKLGNQWTPNFFIVLASDPTALVATNGAGIVGASKSVGVSSSSITYELPSMMSGLSVKLQRGQGSETAASTAGQNTGMSATYTSGPMMFAYGTQKLTAASGETFTTSASSTDLVPTTALVAGSDVIKSTAYVGSYDLGMATVIVGGTKDKVNGSTAKTSGSSLGVSIPLGAATKLGIVSTSATSTTDAGTDYKEKGTRYAVFHSLSKRTQVYAFTGKSSLNNASTAITSTALGIQHAF